MKKYWTREDLYLNVDSLMSQLGYELSLESYPLSSKDIAQTYCYNLYLEEIEFQKTDICGILVKGRASTSIALNKKRDKAMQNFDCMHELIHYFLHDISYSECIYSESKPISQNRIIEWQANEGAAQALVPYQIFIPEYVSYSKRHAHDAWKLVDTTTDLAKMFNVTPKVIKNRIDNLEYEICQYLSGIPVENIQLFSKKKIKEMGLSHYVSHYLYCTNCLSILNKQQHFCHICGTDLLPSSLKKLLKATKGVGYMIYSGHNLSPQNSKAIKCPRCDNEQIIPNGDYCKICGAYLINKCWGAWETDDYGERIFVEGCGGLVDGNSRFCALCGKPTTFFRDDLLLEWEKEIKNLKRGG